MFDWCFCCLPSVLALLVALVSLSVACVCRDSCCVSVCHELTLDLPDPRNLFAIGFTWLPSSVLALHVALFFSVG